jgi:YD repeat-containing protein
VSWTTRHRARGRLSSVATTGIPASPASVSYEYDTAGRLASAGKEQFGYDAAGDLTTPPGGPQQQYNALGELESGNGSSYTYNDEGDLTSAAIDGGAPQSLSYNQAGELTSYQSGTASASYSYNGEGLLASTTVNGFATGYTWDLSQADQELLAAGSTSYNIYGPDGQPVEQVTGSTATFLIADQQGNTRLLTSKTGTVVGTYSYGPYGTAAYSCPRGQDEGCITTALLYGGQYTDGASGDPYLDGRHYDPATGQFLAPAPATVGASARPTRSQGTIRSTTTSPVSPGTRLIMGRDRACGKSSRALPSRSCSASCSAFCPVALSVKAISSSVLPHWPGPKTWRREQRRGSRLKRGLASTLSN